MIHNAIKYAEPAKIKSETSLARRLEKKAAKVAIMAPLIDPAKLPGAATEASFEITENAEVEVHKRARGRTFIAPTPN